MKIDESMSLTLVQNCDTNRGGDERTTVDDRRRIGLDDSDKELSTSTTQGAASAKKIVGLTIRDTEQSTKRGMGTPPSAPYVIMQKRRPTRLKDVVKWYPKATSRTEVGTPIAWMPVCVLTYHVLS